VEARVGNEDANGVALNTRLLLNNYCGKFKGAPSDKVKHIECKPSAIKGQFVTVQKYAEAPPGLWVLEMDEMDIEVLL